MLMWVSRYWMLIGSVTVIGGQGVLDRSEQPFSDGWRPGQHLYQHIDHWVAA